MTGSWLASWHPEPDGRPVLLCLPPAGAGCGQFREWQRVLGDDIAVIGVQLPGREARWADPDPASVDEVVGGVAADLSTLIPAEHPLVVYGHSFGGLLGYEITRSLRKERDQRVRALVVAACRPPHHWTGPGRGLAENDRALAGLLDDRGLSADDLDEDSRELMLDVLRRDARLSLTYTGVDLTAVDCAMEAWGGEMDRTVLPEHVRGWRDYAAGDFRSRMFPGGHYFGLDTPAETPALLHDLATGPSTSPSTGGRA
ncbi:surfactin synthase thioesterase subunit [Nonomuraea polychroma]|uniref:Surfactin synthase thioesterase subunit n=1 Tax=Nonomuraea polychroma TaxID=46176 RepID=A0A438LYV7_9ACTN|nr:alpha/beta fold hydrolase [Nonomuraea polychroma]RVX38734.1 surfactin synthase thioesterase subunit [Nonomuraea polychroma]